MDNEEIDIIDDEEIERIKEEAERIKEETRDLPVIDDEEIERIKEEAREQAREHLRNFRPPRPPRPPTPPRAPRSSRRGRNITIRGIDSNTYDKFSRAIKMSEMTLGEAISRMMREFLKKFEGEFPELNSNFLRNGLRLPKASISGYEFLSVSENDLIEANTRFSFSHIDQLTFEPDVTPETFTRHVRSIAHCDLVKIPSILPKLLVYSKISRCENIKIYQVEDDEVTDKIQDENESDFD